MNNLLIKSVEFFGDSLVAVKDEATGKIFTGVSYICKGIGLSKSQKDTQVQNIQNDLVLNKGCLKFQAGVIDPNNEVLGIELDFLPLWLAKISITPKMQEEQPEVAEKLVNYQLRAKDVLAKAFIKPISKELQAILMIDEKTVELDNRMTKIENNTTIDYSQQQELNDLANKKVVAILGGKDTAAYRELAKKAFRSFWHDYKNKLNVNSYRNTLIKDFESAKQAIINWKPTRELELMIKGCNSPS
ncbi:ORF6C domain-containing protein [Clostridium beijerinckii]|uniref:ORF6C domain-containing protein n=1 Tax=Clostridium beijerinckii TaxID=1520 RepID=UPI000684E8FB|nr:ORF6C domain-containing protein [Clostridium beijerinckii]